LEAGVKLPHVLELNKSEKEGLIKNFDQFNQLKHAKSIPEKICTCEPKTVHKGYARCASQ
jgi:hypothetical protein